MISTVPMEVNIKKKAWNCNLPVSEVSPNTHAPNKNSQRQWRERLTFRLGAFENWRFSDTRIKANAFNFNILFFLSHTILLLTVKSNIFFYSHQFLNSFFFLICLVTFRVYCVVWGFKALSYQPVVKVNKRFDLSKTISPPHAQ